MSKYTFKEMINKNGDSVGCMEYIIPDNAVKQIRADAIEEFVEKICEKYTEEERKGNYKQYCCEIKQNIADIAEKLKAGGNNE